MKQHSAEIKILGIYTNDGWSITHRNHLQIRVPLKYLGLHSPALHSYYLYGYNINTAEYIIRKYDRLVSHSTYTNLLLPAHIVDSSFLTWPQKDEHYYHVMLMDPND